MSDIVFGYLWEYLFTSDEIYNSSVFGTICIMGSVMVVVWGKKKREEQEKSEKEMVGAREGEHLEMKDVAVDIDNDIDCDNEEKKVDGGAYDFKTVQ